MYGASDQTRYIGRGFYSLFIQSQVLYSLTTPNTFKMANPLDLVHGAGYDAFGYIGARYNNFAQERVRFEHDRDELQQVTTALRARFGRRRLFRVADVAQVVRELRRQRDGVDAPATPAGKEVKRLRTNMIID